MFKVLKRITKEWEEWEWHIFKNVWVKLYARDCDNFNWKEVNKGIVREDKFKKMVKMNKQI